MWNLICFYSNWPFNVRTPMVKSTCTDHLQVVQEVVNPDAKIEFRDNTSDDPSRRKPDITKVRQL